MTVLRISTPDDATLDVIFVHGLDGDPQKTWQRNQSGSNWNYWLADDTASLAIWSVGYEASSSGWRGPAMGMEHRALNILAELQGYEIGRRPICFIAHSLGGLLVKEMLVHAANRQNAFTEFADNTKGVVFLSTPHTGSGLTKAVKALKPIYRGTQAVADLQKDNAHLLQLAGQYRSWVNKIQIDHLVLFETQPIMKIKVVDAVSADPGLADVWPIPVDANHIDICKPQDRSSVVYMQVKKFLLDVQEFLSPPNAHCSLPENLVDNLGSFYRGLNIFKLQLEALINLINPVTWKNRLSTVFRAGDLAIAPAVLDELKEISNQIRVMSWPRTGHEEIICVIKALGTTVDAFIAAFEDEAEPFHNLYIFPRFYKSYGNENERYAQLERYRKERSLVEDWLLEVTRYVNLFSDLVKEELEIDNPNLIHHASLEIEQHGLSVSGLIVPEFSEEEIKSKTIPLSTPTAFITERYSRQNFSSFWKPDAATPMH